MNDLIAILIVFAGYLILKSLANHIERQRRARYHPAGRFLHITDGPDKGLYVEITKVNGKATVDEELKTDRGK